MKHMISKYKGTCRTCGGHIAKGSEITWSRAAGARCIKCSNATPTNGLQAKEERVDWFDMMVEDKMAADCGL